MPSYTDKNYNKKKKIYDVLAQVFQDLKTDCDATCGWNGIGDLLQSTTMKLLGEGTLELCCNEYKIGTLDDLLRSKDDGVKYLKEVEKEFKKRFKKFTGKALKLKKVHEDQSVEQVTQLQYYKTGRPLARYLFRDKRVYEFDFEVLGAQEEI